MISDGLGWTIDVHVHLEAGSLEDAVVVFIASLQLLLVGCQVGVDKADGGAVQVQPH